MRIASTPRPTSGAPFIRDPDHPTLRTTLTLREAGVVSLLCFGLPITVSLQSAARNFPVEGFSDTGMLWTCMFEVSAAIAALTYLRWQQQDLQPALPRPTLRGSLTGVLLALVAWLVVVFATEPFAGSSGAGHVQQMMFASQPSSAVIVLTAMVNGTFEEVFLLGILTRGLRGFGLSVAIGLPLLLRTSYHLYQGPVGMLAVALIGLALALHYVRSGQLWPPVFAHMLWDVLPFCNTGV